MFALSKLAGVLAEPANLLLLALIAGSLVLALSKRRRMGEALIFFAAVGFAAIAVFPVGRWIAAPLEDRFVPPLPMPPRVDGVVVLGGAILPGISKARHQVSLNGAAERLTAILELGKLYPEARFIFSGGSGSALYPDAREAPFAKAFLESVGFDTHRVQFEAHSRNTAENAAFSKEMAQPQPGEVWLLVTSAVHMPRAMASFRQVGWPVLAYPVDYLTAGRGAGGIGFDLDGGMRPLSSAAHEWMGLIYYWARGWTETVIPAP